MTYLAVIIDRLKSENPRFFNIILYLAICLFALSQAALFADNYLGYLHPPVRAMLDDVCTSAATAAIMSQLTKKPKDAGSTPTGNP